MKKIKQKVKYVLLLSELNNTFFCKCVKRKTFCKKCQKTIREVSKFINEGIYAMSYNLSNFSYFYYLSKDGKNDKIINREDLSLFNIIYEPVLDEEIRLLLFKRINSFLYRVSAVPFSISLLPFFSFSKISLMKKEVE